MSEFHLPRPPHYEGALLIAKGMTMRFGGVTAVARAFSGFAQGGIAGIIGPNGAGKTTAFNVLGGLHPGRRRHP